MNKQTIRQFTLENKEKLFHIFFFFYFFFLSPSLSLFYFLLYLLPSLAQVPAPVSFNFVFPHPPLLPYPLRESNETWNSCS